jgi:hypothetical protein
MKDADNGRQGIVTMRSGITARKTPKATTRDQKEPCFRPPDPSGPTRGAQQGT